MSETEGRQIFHEGSPVATRLPNWQGWIPLEPGAPDES